MEEICERDDDAWFEQRMMKELTEQFSQMIWSINEGSNSESGGDDFIEDDNGYVADIVQALQCEEQDHRGDASTHRYEERHWEFGIEVEILEFHGGFQAEEFLNWLATVKDILEFRVAPEDRKVPLVATRLRGHETVRW